MTVGNKQTMPILGKNGLWAAGLYLATIWGLYGQKDAGFKDKKELEAVENVAARKRVADASGNKTEQARIINEIREARVAVAKSAKRAGTEDFQKAFMKQTTFVR